MAEPTREAHATGGAVLCRRSHASAMGVLASRSWASPLIEPALRVLEWIVHHPGVSANLLHGFERFEALGHI
jgi:hypothetical protein